MWSGLRAHVAGLGHLCCHSHASLKHIYTKDMTAGSSNPTEDLKSVKKSKLNNSSGQVLQQTPKPVHLLGADMDSQ